MKKKLSLLTLLVCFAAVGLFSSCVKEEGVITGVTYDLKGTQWKTYYNDNGDDIYLFATFSTDNAGIYHFICEDGGKFKESGGEFDVSANFTYSIDGSYGSLSCSCPDEDISIRYLLVQIYGIPVDAELHLIDKNTLSIGGCVFTRQ